MLMLIPGPRSPGMNIDVYLRPLVDELKELWVKGVETHWMPRSRGILNYMPCYIGQLMIFLHMRCCRVGAQKVNLDVHTATCIQTICD
jgi:hypothetical protein